MLILSDQPLSQKQLKLVAVLKAFSCGSIFKPNFDDEGVQRVWVSKLEGLPPRGLLKSLDELCVKKEFPSIEKIIEVVNGGDGLSADEAFSQVWAALGRSDLYRQTLSTEIQATVDKLGSWAALGHWTETQRPAHKKQFKDMYQEIVASHATGVPLLDAAKKAEQSREHSRRSMEAADEELRRQRMTPSPVQSDLAPVYSRLGGSKSKSLPAKPEPARSNVINASAQELKAKFSRSTLRIVEDTDD